MNVHRWDTDADGPLTARVFRAKLEKLGYSVTRYQYPPGTYFAPHLHEIDKIAAVLSGRFRIIVEGHEVVLGAGDWLEVPRRTMHTAEVVGDETVVSLDAVRR